MACDVKEKVAASLTSDSVSGMDYIASATSVTSLRTSNCSQCTCNLPGTDQHSLTLCVFASHQLLLACSSHNIQVCTTNLNHTAKSESLPTFLVYMYILAIILVNKLI